MFSDKRYTALPILIGFLRLLGALPLFCAVMFFVTGAYTAFGGHGPTSTVILLGIFFGLLFFSVIFFAAAEILQVLMDIEENTRQAADDRLLAAVTSVSRGPEPLLTP